MKPNELSPADLYGDSKLTTSQAITQTKADMEQPIPYYEKEHTVKGPKILSVICALCPLVAIALFWIYEIFDVSVIVFIFGWILLAVTILISILQKRIWK